MVSTDDVGIAEVAVKYGAKVPFYRSKINSNDYATTFDVIEEVVSKYKSLNKEFDYTCCLYACAPFATANKLREALEQLQEHNFDSVFPVVPFGFPIQRALKKGENNSVNACSPQFNLTRSQDLEQNYHDTGQFYWMNTEKCLEKKAVLTDNTGCIVISEMEAQDIDTETDWKLAELKYELLQSLK